MNDRPTNHNQKVHDAVTEYGVTQYELGFEAGRIAENKRQVERLTELKAVEGGLVPRAVLADVYERLMFFRLLYLNPTDGRGGASGGFTYLSGITEDIGKTLDAYKAGGT
jgi:hypothetical protein